MKDNKMPELKPFDMVELFFDEDFRYVIGDSTKDLLNLGEVDYIVTSPPYHNILRKSFQEGKE